MPTASLPDRPDIEQLKGNAKTLRDLVRAGFDEPVELVREHHPRLPELEAGSPEATGFKLADAQLTLARQNGYASWPKLRRYVETVNRLTRSPHAELGDDAPGDPSAGTADELLRLACLNYGADDPARWARAADLLAAHPELARASIHSACATGDVAAVTAFLEDDPESVRREGGPFRWEPLLYLTYSRLAVDDADRDPVAVARLLCDRGADPNAGYLWDGLPSPFTALTGVFGRGEQGAPPHRDELRLARVLLEAGAEANDSQTIYNRGIGDLPADDTAFLDLLFEFGLGRGDGGPWRRLLGHEHQTPAEMLADLLQQAAEADLVHRARLLLAHGVDPNRPGSHPGFAGRRPYEGAVGNGNAEVAALLAAAGADTTAIDPLSRFVGACLGADRTAVGAALAAEPGLLDRAIAERGDLIARAAELDRSDAITLLVDLGFDVDFCGRATALHEAAFRGHREVVARLLDLGADPTILDPSFHSTPRGWAEHGGHTDIVAYLDERVPTT